MENDLEELEELAFERDEKYLVFLRTYQDLIIYHMSYLLLKGLPKISYGLSPWGKAMAKFHAELFHQLKYGRDPKKLRKIWGECLEALDESNKGKNKP